MSSAGSEEQGRNGAPLNPLGAPKKTLSMEQLTQQFRTAEELTKQANKAKREAAEQRKVQRDMLLAQQQASLDPEKQTMLADPVEVTPDTLDLSKHDVSDDVISKQRLPEWKDEALQTIPSFSCVVDRLMSVEQWSSSALRLMQQFTGAEAMKVRALRDAVPITELKARDIDLTQYSVASFLNKIVTIWNDTIGHGRVKAVMVRPQGRSWIEFRHDLLSWAAVHGVPVDDGWLLAQMRANIEMHRDILSASPVNSESWARIMDRTEGMYNHAKQDVQASTPVATVDSEEPIDVVKRGYRKSRRQHQFTSDGKPICDKCHQVGHTKKRCPQNKKQRQNRK